MNINKQVSSYHETIGDIIDLDELQMDTVSQFHSYVINM